MKLLVGGCSYSAGHGFPEGIDDPNIWPNLLAKEIGAELTNVSQLGYDNPGIFLNLLKELTTNHYDLILFQVTGLNRIILSTANNGSFRVGEFNRSRYVSDSDYRHFHKVFVELNKDAEHWYRLMNMLIAVQGLVKQGHNIRLINGLLDWDKDFFENDMSSFAKSMVDFDKLLTSDAERSLKKINQDKQKIDLSLWLNPFDSLDQTKLDTVSKTDTHPGPLSQTNYTRMIVKNLNLL